MAVTAADVAAWGRFDTPTGDELTLIDNVIAAVTVYLSRHYVIDDPTTAAQDLAITMQTARLWKRRDTPEGRDAFGGEFAVTVSGVDGDVSDLLEPKPGVA